tara:strand:- start:2570 stop:3010 length:441 start_codon:yes stop_codon:yes gene_type:complete
MPRSNFNFSYAFRVRYSEIDAQKIVFNAHYLTYFDTAITEYFRSLPYNSMEAVERLGEDFHTVRTVVEYHKSIEFDEEIEVLVRVSRMGRSSITFQLEVHSLREEDLRATGEVIWVNTNQETHLSSPIPEELVEKLLSREGPNIKE